MDLLGHPVGIPGTHTVGLDVLAVLARYQKLLDGHSTQGATSQVGSSNSGFVLVICRGVQQFCTQTATASDGLLAECIGLLIA